MWGALLDVTFLLGLDHLIAHPHLDLLDLLARQSLPAAINLSQNLHLSGFYDPLLGDDGLGVGLDIYDLLRNLIFDLVLFFSELLPLDHPVDAVLTLLSLSKLIGKTLLFTPLSKPELILVASLILHLLIDLNEGNLLSTLEVTIHTVDDGCDASTSVVTILHDHLVVNEFFLEDYVSGGLFNGNMRGRDEVLEEVDIFHPGFLDLFESSGHITCHCAQSRGLPVISLHDKACLWIVLTVHDINNMNKGNRPGNLISVWSIKD